VEFATLSFMFPTPCLQVRPSHRLPPPSKSRRR